MIIKVRIGIDDSQRLNYIPGNDAKLTDESVVKIQKVACRLLS